MKYFLIIIILFVLSVCPVLAHEDKVWKHMEEPFRGDGIHSCSMGIVMWKKYKENKWYGVFVAHDKIHITRFYVENPNCTDLFDQIKEGK